MASTPNAGCIGGAAPLDLLWFHENPPVVIPYDGQGAALSRWVRYEDGELLVSPSKRPQKEEDQELSVYTQSGPSARGQQVQL